MLISFLAPLEHEISGSMQGFDSSALRYKTPLSMYVHLLGLGEIAGKSGEFVAAYSDMSLTLVLTLT